MDRNELVTWWDEAHGEGVWWAPWRRVLDDVTADEAAWQPAPGRHAIWQIVNHIIFWREYFCHRIRGGTPHTEAELDSSNWRSPPEVTEEAWRQARERFAETHAAVRAMLADPATPHPPKPQLDPRYLPFHDTYHIGQIMYIRALLGKSALES